jgi:hypothetical protein
MQHVQYIPFFANRAPITTPKHPIKDTLYKNYCRYTNRIYACVETVLWNGLEAGVYNNAILRILLR